MANIYIGTYTDPQGSKGIYRVRLNLSNGALSEPELAAEATAPSFMALSRDGRFLYAVNEYADGEASAFGIEGQHLRKLNSVQFDGKGSCHISLDSTGKWLFVSAYRGGTLTVLPILEDGSIGPPSDHFKNAGGGPDKARQEAPHMHFTAQAGSFVYACDLGADEILAFRFDGQSGRLTGSAPHSARPLPGSGPRHFAVHPDGKTLYVNTEMGMSVAVFDRNPANGQLRLVQTASTLSGEGPNEEWTTSAIRLHRSLPVLYVSNRGPNSIAVFGIRKDGRLEFQGTRPVGLDEPRDFDIDPSGKWMVVAGQSSGELVSLALDAETGIPGEVVGRCKLVQAVCVAFAP